MKKIICFFLLFYLIFSTTGTGQLKHSTQTLYPTYKGLVFAGMDGQAPDHYLWLTGEAARRLRKEKPLELKMPVRDKR